MQHHDTTRAPVAIGQVLAGKYRVDRILGVGGMGVVVAATHTTLDQRVALKFMLPAALASGDSVGRFTREARAAVRLRSEHVARVLDVGTLDNGSPYIVMEYLEGEDLAEWVRARGALDVSTAADFILQACDALAEAHALGIVHRDLKPANLFVARHADGAPLVKVLDFGISKSSNIHDAALAVTGTTAIMGSPLYMSPEQMKSARNVDARSDIWALGVILHELTTGSVPFNAESLGSLMAHVLGSDPIARVEAIRPDVGTAFGAVVGRCLERDRDRRFPNVAEVALALAPFAPPHAQMLVDRVCRVQGVPASRSSPDSAEPLPPPSVASSVPVVAAGVRTSTLAHRPANRRGAVAAFAVFAAIGTLGFGTSVLVRQMRQRSATTPPSISATTMLHSATAPLGEAIPAAPTPIPTAPTATAAAISASSDGGRTSPPARRGPQVAASPSPPQTPSAPMPSARPAAPATSQPPRELFDRN